MFPRLDLYHTDPAQHTMTVAVGSTVDDLYLVRYTSKYTIYMIYRIYCR